MRSELSILRPLATNMGPAMAHRADGTMKISGANMQLPVVIANIMEPST